MKFVIFFFFSILIYLFHFSLFTLYPFIADQKPSRRSPLAPSSSSSKNYKRDVTPLSTAINNFNGMAVCPKGLIGSWSSTDYLYNIIFGCGKGYITIYADDNDEEGTT